MLANQIKTPSQLKSFVEDTGSHFFDRATMKFFGDTMRNFGLCRDLILTRDGEKVNAFALYRKQKTAKGAGAKTWYFHPETFKEIYPANPAPNFAD